MQKKNNTIQKNFRIDQSTDAKWKTIVEHYKNANANNTNNEQNYVFKQIINYYYTKIIQQTQQQQKKGFFAKLFCKFCR